MTSKQLSEKLLTALKIDKFVIPSARMCAVYCEMISDMTKGNPLKLIISFSVPMLIGNIFQQVYNFVDAAIVGKFVGAESLAAVGSTGTIVGVMICLMMGLTSGAGIIIAQCFGSRNFDELRKTVTGLIYIVGILAVITSVAGVVFSRAMIANIGYGDSWYAMWAGLHFTPELLEKIKAKGVNIGYVTLHVGLGTFRPVKADDILEHKMHSEFYILPQETADLVNKTKSNGKRVISVGTTATRVLETVGMENEKLEQKTGWTNIFIYPGKEFHVIDALITNFHLPESTLIMLVSALAGRENVLNAYKTAVQEKYRFFSFGDAMLIK